MRCIYCLKSCVHYGNAMEKSIDNQSFDQLGVNRGEQKMVEDAGTVQDKKIYELTEIVDERNGQSRILPDGKKSQPVIVVDGRGYERVKVNGHRIHDLTEVVEDVLSPDQINDRIMKRVDEMVEKIAREVVPDIAERIIKKEIEKIQGMGKDHSMKQD